MSARGDPGSRFLSLSLDEGRTRVVEQTVVGTQKGRDEETEREREIRRRCNNGAMGRLSWGSLCLVCGLALCASAPLIAIVDLLAAAFRKLPPKAASLPRGRRRKDASSGGPRTWQRIVALPELLLQP